ncbi:MAG: YqeG family HAD IIIA-type phosphatase [Lachnospiraceae bacterium]
MFQVFYPERYVSSAYEISYETLREQGVRGVIFDIDNTLVPHGAPADERALALFARLKALGMQTCLLSNNQEPRVASFAGQVDSLYIFKGGKPAVKNYHRAMEMMGTDCSTTVFVGDQLFTDVYGAKRAGIPNILVKPIHPKEEIQIVFKRKLEALVLWEYKRQRGERQDED